MTYKERIASAQAKMDQLKDKMAESAKKARAARTMKKEEITAAIDAINADLDELSDAIVAEMDAIDDQVDTGIAAVQDDISAAKETMNYSLKREGSKIEAIKQSAQKRALALKAKIAEKRSDYENMAREAYINELLDYAESCQQTAYAAAVEADLAFLEAAKIIAE